MFLLILFLIAGIAAGVALHKKPRVQSISEKLTTITVFLLLFTLGLKAGADKYIVSHLSTLGFTALVIALFAVTGSLVSALLVYKVISKKHRNEK